MEAQRRSKRKPLSDCTNTIPNHRKKPPSSSSSSKNPNSTKTLIKPPKSSIKSINEELVVVPPTSSSQKSHTSIGSNDSSNSVTVPPSPEPPAPPTPLSDADRKTSGLSVDQSPPDDETRSKDKGKMVVDACVTNHNRLSVDQSHRNDETRRKEKGKLVDTPIIDGNNFGLSFDQTLRDDETRRKEKGKMVVDTPIIDLKKSGLSVDQVQQDDETRRKEKGKMVVDTHFIDRNKSGLSVDLIQRDDEAKRKDKGKMVVDTPIIPFSAYMSSKPLQIGSSAASGRNSRSGTQAVQSQNLHAQITKDKGKTTANVSVLESPARFISKHLELSSSGMSSSFFEASVPRSQELYEERMKEKGKMVLEAPHIEESEPSTPHAVPASPATSVTRDRPLTIYGQRKGRHGRKHAVGKMNFSSSSEQRIRKTGFELDDDRGLKKGSHTDPLPMHKKRSREKYGDSVHVMPQEEVEKLRAYYADIDAFELPEEAVSESDLD